GQGGTLTGTMTHGLESRPVFTATVNAAGEFTVTMHAPLAHPSNHNGGGETEWEDNVTLNLGYTITDGDGDTIVGSLNLSVDDDTPDARDDRHTITGQTEGPISGNVITGAGTD